MKEVFNGRTIRGVTDANAVGKTGGKESHRHTVSKDKDTVDDGSGATVMDYKNLNTDWQSNWPPYVNVIICCKK